MPLLRRRSSSSKSNHSLRGSSSSTPPSFVFFSPFLELCRTQISNKHSVRSGSSSGRRAACQTLNMPSAHIQRAATTNTEGATATTTTTTTPKAPGGVQSKDCKRIFKALAGGKSSRSELMLLREGQRESQREDRVAAAAAACLAVLLPSPRLAVRRGRGGGERKRGRGGGRRSLGGDKCEQETVSCMEQQLRRRTVAPPAEKKQVRILGRDRGKEGGRREGGKGGRSCCFLTCFKLVPPSLCSLLSMSSSKEPLIGVSSHLGSPLILPGHLCFLHQHLSSVRPQQ